ncbi:MAG: R3H domain-containing nucleic acid-binding protein [Chloroflexota bacterium]
MQKVVTDDLEALLDILPPHISQLLSRQKEISDLLEVVLDLGRSPEARFPRGEVILIPREVDAADIEHVVSRISSFGEDNRAGIERTLHRISAIRNRKGRIVGLTCRVGRAVFGTIRVIEDLVESGKSVLLLGRPGVGKTTMLREVARVLADDLKKRVIIVDTSNEIAGDGDIPHPAIGHARRMQVVTPVQQHAVMIEAVENHMPEVIVIDEIGTELEAMAARTIAERGVQLVGTAHGNTLENLMMNPTLADLIGGIQSVTLSDEEAKRRGTQKSILERKSKPTFDIVVEIQDWDRVALHPDVASAVDDILRGGPPATEVRWVDAEGTLHTERLEPEKILKKPGRQAKAGGERAKNLYLFGVNRARLEQTARDMNLNLRIVENPADADILVTSKHYYRRKPQKIRDAENNRVPIYVLKSNTPPQIRQLLQHVYPMAVNVRQENNIQHALGEAEEAAEIINGGQESVELSPQSAYIRRLQHLIAQRHELSSQSVGKDPVRRVRIFRAG